MAAQAITDTRLHGHSLWLARLGWAAIFLLVAGILAANAPYLSLDTHEEWIVGEARWAALAFFPSYSAFVQYVVALKWLSASVFVGTALFLAWRRPDDWMVLYVSATLLLMAILFGIGLNISILRYPAWLAQNLPAIRVVVPTLLVATLVLLFYLFPDGRFVPRPARWLVWLAVAGTLLFIYAETVPWQARPVHLPGELGWHVFIFSVLTTMLVGLSGQVLRYRRLASPEQRRQVRLILFGLAALLCVPLGEELVWMVLSLLRIGDESFKRFVALHLQLVTPLLLPLTIGVSVLRYRLWEVELLVSRALLYGALTALILGLYVLAVGAASVLLPSQIDWLASLVALGAAVAVAVLLRRRAQALAERWIPMPHGGGEPLDQNTPGVSLAGLALLLTRAAWVAFTLSCAAAFLRELPAYARSTGAQWLVQTSYPAVAQVATLNTFVGYVLALRLGASTIIWLAAGLLFWRKSSDRMALFAAWILLAIPYGLTLGDTASRWLHAVAWLSFAGFLLFLFVFPDGRFVPRSTRGRLGLLVVLIPVPVLAYLVFQASAPHYTPEEWGYAAVMATIGAIMTAGVAGQIYRYRALATPVQRQQTKWVLFGLSLQLLWIGWLLAWLAGIQPNLGIPEPATGLVMLHLIVLVPLLLAITIGVAMLRYRLWDVDMVLRRTLVYTMLTALVVALYVLVVGGLGALLHTGNNLLLTILATGLIAALFHPVRQRLQQGVNRLLYGERDDPLTVLARLGERLEAATVPTDSLSTIVETIAQALKLPYVAATMRQDGAFQVVVASGDRSAVPLHRFPLTYQTETIGELLIAPRGVGESFTPAEQRLLENLARQAGTAVYAANLTDRLQRSRERLVVAREEERRRLRRDLHDGLGPELASLSLKLDALHNLLRHNPAAAETLLLELKTQTQAAIADIRRLVYDLRPPALDQFGLISALREYVASTNRNDGLQIAVDAPATLPPLPAAVEVAAYRIAQEAITNVIRHAHARHCTLRLALCDGLSVEVRDDGRGLPAAYVAGVGLTSMRERAAELGGTLAIEALPEGGTVIRAHLPLTSREEPDDRADSNSDRR